MSRYTGLPSHRTLANTNPLNPYPLSQSVPPSTPIPGALVDAQPYPPNEVRPRLYDRDAPEPKNIPLHTPFYAHETWSQVAVAGERPDDNGRENIQHDPSEPYSYIIERRKRDRRQSRTSGKTRPLLNEASRPKSDLGPTVKHVRFALPTEQAEEKEPRANSSKTSTRPPQPRSQTAPSRVDLTTEEIDHAQTQYLKNWIYQPEVYPNDQPISASKSTASTHHLSSSHPPPPKTDAVYLPQETPVQPELIPTSGHTSSRSASGRTRAPSVSSNQSDYSSTTSRSSTQRPMYGYKYVPSPLSPLSQGQGAYGWAEQPDDAAWRAMAKANAMGEAEAIMLRRNAELRAMDGRVSGY
ncbi:hypothetical protein NA57DRAFT_52380 [Rhizodiscina lignyota]|uniref:Uncharacterized protein n=1 Tax=Rhizodiscina lignyota TaxID=1504668 RepID=A0A9P4IMT5_9PEZI|nr:hypothetical protein NA57DRAFT_52380 [Rhizodiscina lignyota]